MSFDLKINQGDLQLGRNGDLQQIADTDKLVQDVLKMALTPIGANTFFPWYGSTVSANLIGTPFNLGIIGPLASDQLKSSLKTLITLQQIQTNNGQKVSPYELLAAVKQVQIERNITDPRYFRVVIEVLTKALTTIATSFDVTL